jgi:hypothetical protein
MPQEEAIIFSNGSWITFGGDEQTGSARLSDKQVYRQKF